MSSPLYTQVFNEFVEKAKDPAWLMAFEICMGEWVRDISAYHQGPIQAIADRAMLRHLDKTRDIITKRYLLDRIAEIRKDADFDPTKHKRGGNPHNRGQFSRTTGPGSTSATGTRTMPGAFPSGERWDASGRHLGEQMGANLGTPYRYDTRRNAQAVVGQQRREMLSSGKIPQATAASVVGLVGRPQTLDINENAGDHEADLLSRAAAMTYALQEKTRSSADKQRIQYTIVGPHGSRVETPIAGQVPEGIDYEGGERVKYMVPIGADNPVTVAGKIMDIGQVAGLDSESAAKAGSVVQDIHESLNTTQWGTKLNHAANIARVMSNNSPIAVQAHAVASVIDLLGPEAARAFGPKMRQLSYRYTGQEAKGTQMSDTARSGKGENESVEGFENRLIVDLSKELPSKIEYKAALQAGSTPPSKGYILDKDGKVVTESVGFADDWYTPFNLKRLPKLKDGSYVRTRGFGGITPEDIQLALHTGANRVTVVSNSGVFQLELDPRGKTVGHRFGFGGTSMQRRYAKSLDAIVNNRVENPDSPGGRLQLDQRGYAIALRDLKNKYPYFVKNVRVGNPISGAGSPEPGNPDGGYIRPLSIKASGARYGYADPAVGGSRSSYDDVTAYQLRKAQFAALKRTEEERSKPQDRPSAGTSTTSRDNRSPAEMARERNERVQREARGEGTSVSAYAKEEPLPNTVVGPDLALMRQIVQQDGIGNVESDDADVNEFLQVLATGARSGDKDYNEIRAKYAGSKAFRSRVHQEMDTLYGPTPLGQTVLPSLLNAHREDVPSDVKADAEAKVAEQGESENIETAGLDRDYEPDDVLPRPVVMESPAIQQWLSNMSYEGETNPRQAARRGFFNKYIDVQEADSRSGTKDAYNAMSEEEKFLYREMHNSVIQRLNAERAGFNDDFDEEREPERIPPPTRPATPRDQEQGPQGASRYRVQALRDILEADDNDVAHEGANQVQDIYFNDEIPSEQTLDAVQAHIDWMEEQEAELHRQGHSDMANKLAAAVHAMRDQALDWETEGEE